MKMNILKKLFKKRTTSKKALTQEEKANILERKLTISFTEFDRTTNQVNVFPPIRAHNEVERIKKEGSLDFYFEWYLLHEAHQKRIAELQNAYKRNFENLQARYLQNNCLQVQN